MASEPAVFIASDHAGFRLKQILRAQFPLLPWRDLGPATDARVDYPDFADLAARAVRDAGQAPGSRERPLLSSGVLSETFGVLICGSGQGMCMRANRYLEIRAALAWNEESARLSRAHNDANILCLGERLIEPALAEKILSAFLAEGFEGGRHAGRVQKLSSPR